MYLARCYPESPHPVYGVGVVDSSDSRGAAYNRVWACVGHNRQIPLRPGQARTDTLRLIGPNVVDGRTGQPRGAFVGRMRLFYEVQTCPGDGACRLGQEAGASNAFAVELASSP